ncbi:MAG: hypothetical protein DHS20C18_09180 [Saprospiraceae bacterium]|nr:MAG: hypothetical protein DHS20C18_09180 [Saprospiraceae bacterium]
MKASFQTSFPDEKFWEAYQQLWSNSKHRSPFQVRHFIYFLANRYRNKLCIYQCFREGTLIGAAFFKKDKGSYTFLSEVKSDHNYFVLDQSCSSTELEFFFQQFFQEIKKRQWAFTLNNQPSWEEYMAPFIDAGEKSGLFWNNAPYSVCPTLKETSGQSLFERFNQSRELRYRVNRMKNQQEATFEVFREDEDLEEWVEAFCRLHILRWENTTSPSRYIDPEQRSFLLNCLSAWIADRVLVRFSVKIGDGTRVGFVICLIQNDTLIHHTTAYDDAYRKYSPGKALLHFIGEWMAEAALKNLDFGQGNEKYKYEFTNTEPILNRIFISSPLKLPFILKAKISRSIRDNEKLRKFFRERIKPLTQKVRS